MASNRELIISATVSALSGSSEINYVTTKKEPWWDWDLNRFPGVCVIANRTDKRQRFSFVGTSGDMYSELELSIIGYAFDANNDLAVKRTDLIRTIEKTLVNDATLDSITLDMAPTTVETDQGTLDNFCIVHCKYIAKYNYDHTSP
jgi:hypothetical protein